MLRRLANTDAFLQQEVFFRRPAEKNDPSHGAEAHYRTRTGRPAAIETRAIGRAGSTVLLSVTERQPHEPDAHLSPTAIPALLSGMPALQLRLLRSRVTEGLDGVYALSAGTASWGCMIKGKSVTTLDQGAHPAKGDASLSTDPESMILLTAGRAEVTEKLQSAALTITGNIEQGKQLCATLFRPL